MILCVGALGSGKSTLLKILQQHGIDLDAGDEEVLTGPGATGTTGASSSSSQRDVYTPITTPTMGTDLLTVTRYDKKRVDKGLSEHKTLVREVGGAMAPIWSSFAEKERTTGVLYVVDSSCPENIGSSTVHLVELLSHPALDGLKVMIVFSKMDKKAGRSIKELTNLMRLEEIIDHGNHNVTKITFNVQKQDNIKQIFDWMMGFKIDVIEHPKFNCPLA